MFDPKTLLDQFLGSKVPGTDDSVRDKAGQATRLAKQNPLATGVIAAVLLGTGVGRSLTGSALQLGGMAAIAGLGYQAYKNYQAGKAPQSTPEPLDVKVIPEAVDAGFDMDIEKVDDSFALALVRAMIAAANSDGHVDEEERSRIADRLSVAGMAEDAKAFIDEELQNPTSLQDIVATAQTDAQKVELYTASRLAIDPDLRAERGYLDLLAGRLGLPDALIDHIEATVSGASAK